MTVFCLNVEWFVLSCIRLILHTNNKALITVIDDCDSVTSQCSNRFESQIARLSGTCFLDVLFELGYSKCWCQTFLTKSSSYEGSSINLKSTIYHESHRLHRHALRNSHLHGGRFQYTKGTSLIVGC
jgi:hypothetical protein